MLKFGSKNDVTVVHRATIRLLDDAEIIHCDFQPQHKGRYILEYVCKQLNIIETDYFGLRYVDHCRQRHWLDLAKSVVKQVKDMEPILFSFRVKFYPPDPLRLKDEITRYQIYQQLKRDLLHGRLYCSPGEASLLAACILHNELGEYDPEIHVGNYISEHKLLLKQTETIEEKAMELHQTQLKGFTAEQAEIHFLRLASQLDTYAVDPHPVKDHKGTQLYLGINHHGILTFQGSRQTNHFRWSEVQKINYEGKMFIVHLTITEVKIKYIINKTFIAPTLCYYATVHKVFCNSDSKISIAKIVCRYFQKKHTVGFKCPTGSNCRHVWRCAIEQMLFFTLPRASDAPVVSGGSIFSWGTKFKYTGRTEREVLEETAAASAGSGEASSLRGKGDGPVQRCQSAGLRRKASSVPATPSTPSQDLIEIRYSSLPRSCHSAGLDGAGMAEAGANASGVPLSSPYCPDNTLPLLETVSEDQEIYAKRNNAVDENESHASAHTTTSITNQVKKMKFSNKNTFGRPPALYSQKIVIGSEELVGKNIDNVVRQKINSLEKSPKIIRSTALIIKTSRTPIKASSSLSTLSFKINPGINNTGIKTSNTYSRLIGTTPKHMNGFNSSESRNSLEDIRTIESQVSSSSSVTKTTPKNDNLETTNTVVTANTSSATQKNTVVNGSIISARSRNGPMALAMAIAAAAVAATTSNTSTCGGGNTSKDLPLDVKSRHEPVGGQVGDADTNDYFFRDSFDHSSSESQLVDGLGKTQSRSVTPVPKMQKLQNSKLCLQPVGSATKSIIVGGGSSRSRALRSVRCIRLFVSAFILTVTMLFIVVVIVFETDSAVFESIRKTPEMISFKSHYYVPIREFLRTKLGLF
ncbi:Similar to Frmd5: FERM domain-containing protein 5 (Mus musculus) [Cotesia congregata]|uniref:Moesin/ezrin/radixin homolog 1 n=1 Tax=Cotesia congregata TaxID=51543 RepID=A0A8J2HLZ5_COTCN|nr:Similar to Frmd5: FERM domain-containing protein 5 (Mus musculus) [Cotesia congregata]